MLLLSVFSVLLLTVESFQRQTVGVRGRLTCNNQTLMGATMKLWDKNVLSKDKEIGSATSDRQGAFEIVGGENSFMPLNVYLRIYHDCDDAIIPCRRMINLQVPSKYVYRNPTVVQWFEAGTMNMAFRYPDEERKCSAN